MQTNNQQTAGQEPAKQKQTFLLLGILLGSFGAHNFYAGYTQKGIIQLVITLATCFMGSMISWIWALIDVTSVKQDAKGVPFV